MATNILTECSICNEICGYPHLFGNDRYNLLIKRNLNVIWHNEHFSIIPSIGPLNDGHLLIVPNRHTLSFHFLDNKEIESLVVIKKNLKKFNRKVFKQDTEFFEHGTGVLNNFCGSCVAHAHLHCLPVPRSINDYLNGLNMWKVDSDYVFRNENVDNGYLTVEDLTGQVWFNNKDSFESQILRKYYSKYILNNASWNWRVKPDITKVVEVISHYQSFSIPN